MTWEWFVVSLGSLVGIWMVQLFGPFMWQVVMNTWALIEGKLNDRSEERSWKVKVNRNVSAEELIQTFQIVGFPHKTTVYTSGGNKTDYITQVLELERLLKYMPVYTDEKVELVFFRHGWPMRSLARLKAEYWRRGLYPDPIAHISFQRDRGHLHREGDIASVWSFGYATFQLRFSKRSVDSKSLRDMYSVSLYPVKDGGWDGNQWFVGARRKRIIAA